MPKRLEEGSLLAHAVLLSREKVKQLKLDLFLSRDVLRTEEFAAHLGICLSTVASLSQAGMILALPHPTEEEVFGFPRWHEEECLRGHCFAKISRSLDGVGPWSSWYFFETKTPALENFSPLEVLRGPTHPHLVGHERVHLTRLYTEHNERFDVILDLVCTAARRFAHEA